MSAAPAAADHARIPVVLSWGLGVESTAILLRWLELGAVVLDDQTPPTPLSDLIVITAMTGDEWPDTKAVVETHALPRLVAAGVRFVQVARAGPAQSDGVVTLADSRQPTVLHIAGAGWALSDELLAAGTVPQVASRRLCSLKWKGWPLDTWLAAEMAGRPYRHVIGFNRDETGRAERDRSYSSVERASRYPLIDWDWTRADCETYLAGATGVAHWPKSCCTYCPFARDHHLDRYRRFPHAGADAMFLEHVAVAANPRAALFGSKSVRALVTADANSDALAELQGRLAAVEHAVYDVRRVYPARGLAARSVTAVMVGTRAQAEEWLAARVQPDSDTDRDGEHGTVTRNWLERRADTYPSVERFLVVAPHVIADKQRPGFDAAWQRATNPAPRLFDP
jgi:hypothetical protein